VESGALGKRNFLQSVIKLLVEDTDREKKKHINFKSRKTNEKAQGSS
jgi:hypothetical protein